MNTGRRIAFVRRGVAVVLAAAVAAAGTGCGILGGGSSDHPAVEVVEDLLELRRKDVRDANAYAPFFEDSAIATALAEPGAVATGTPRVPEWRDLYASKTGSSTAEVAVVWKPDDAFRDWPKVTVFSLSLVRDRWVVVDAREETNAPRPVDPARSK
jgi:hypothetical protein